MESGNSILRRAAVLAAIACSGSALASFNSFGNSPFCSNPECVFVIASVSTIVGVPFFAAIFGLLWLAFRDREAPKHWAWWIGTNAVLAHFIVVTVLLMRPPRDTACVYVFLAYALLALCHLRWYPVSHPGDKA